MGEVFGTSDVPKGTPKITNLSLCQTNLPWGARTSLTKPRWRARQGRPPALVEVALGCGACSTS